MEANNTSPHLHIVEPQEVAEARAAGLVVTPIEAPRLYVRAEGREMSVGALPCILLSQEGEYVLIRRLPHGEDAANSLLGIRARLISELQEAAVLEQTEGQALRQRARTAETQLEACQEELRHESRVVANLQDEIRSLRGRTFRSVLADLLARAARALEQ